MEQVLFWVVILIIAASAGVIFYALILAGLMVRDITRNDKEDAP